MVLIRSAAKNRIFLEAGKSRLFDHLVSGGEDGRLEVETQGSCCLEIEYEFELCRLHHRHFSGVRALEDLAP